jgi:predicted nucleic acid-binding protein
VILADTSVWIGHFREHDFRLAALLNSGRVLMHPFVLGELAMGSLASRAQILADLHALPAIGAAMEDEVLGFIERQHLFGLGIGYVDAHLLAAVRLASGARLWTLDKRLASAAGRLGLAAVE